MKPTGWFQVAWSDEIKIGDVHRMKYFDTRDDRLARRVRSADRHGRLLRAPRRPPRLRRPRRGRGHPVPVPRLAVEPRGPQRLHSVPGPAEPGPAHPHLPGRRAQRVGLHLARRRAARPVLRRARRVRELRRRQQRRRLLPAAAALPREPWRCIRSTSSRTASTSRISSSCTRRRSCRCSPATTSTNHVSYVDFTITFEGDDEPEHRRRQERRRGDQRRARHRGDQELGDGRQPDHLRDHAGRRPHLRCPLHGLHRPHGRADDSASAPRPRRASSAQEVIRQFAQDIHIWQHQRYSDPPALASAEQQGFTAIRKWAKQFYPDGIGGSAAELQSHPRKAEPNEPNRQADPRVPGRDGQRRHAR